MNRSFKLNKKNALLLSMSFSAVLTTGCVSNPTQNQLTAEQRAQAAQMQQAFMQKLMGGGAAPLTQKPAEPIQKQEMTEQELAEKVAKIQKDAKGNVEITQVRDGLKINGQAYLDPEGKIISVASNSLTGDIVYQLQVNPTTKTVKYMNAGSNEFPVTLGKVVSENNGATFYSVTGQKVSGDFVLPSSVGVLVARDASAFHYVPGKRLASLAVPEQYHVAPVQRGDIGSTNYILLEKNEIDEKQNSFGSLMKSLNDIGSMVGMSKSDDYVLYNIESHNLVTLDMTIGTKSVANYSQCKKINSFINKCDHVSFYNSIYETDGTPNNGHYFWRIAWYPTNEGTFAVVGEGASMNRVNVIKLDESKKSTVFSRTLGINSVNSYQLPSGKIAIDAQLGFSTESIDDAVAKYHELGPVSIAAAKK